MKRMVNHSSLAFGARMLAIASLLALAGCGGDTGTQPDAGGKGGKGGGSAKGGAGGSTGGTSAGVGGSLGGSGGGDAAGTGGSAGTGGTAGTGGSAGTGGTAGSAGTGGTAGSAGTGGTGASTGDAGTGGTAGSAGTGGTAGSAGSSGAAGSGGTTDGGNDDASDGSVRDGATTGTACTAAADCASNFCVDGVCCDTACTTGCSACVNTKTGQADGVCKPITANTDPDNECPQEAASTCGNDGMCDGLGACRKWGTGITCAIEACTGSTYTPTRVCNGTGACQTVTSVSCGAYLCGATTCKTTCATNSDCIQGDFCMGTTCVGLKGVGATCGAASECSSNFCVDGFCCESACSGGCFACSNAKTGQGDGFCKPISAGTDPDNECPQDTQSSCGLDGQCDGTGQCRRWSGTVCVSESCSGSTYTPARTCNGSGVCQTVATQSCGAYQCGATACKVACTGDIDCAGGNFCLGGICSTVKGQGAPCSNAAQCSTGACVDGVCCESACAGGCMACASAKTTAADGLCRPVLGGTDPDNECTQDPSASCGRDGTCDGAGGCRKYTVGTVCVGQTCTGSTFTPAQTCDGAGTCLPSTNQQCGVYMCGATSCLTACVTNADCTAGNHCSAGMCVPQEGNGTACAVAGDCASGNCVDNVCCNTACNGTCQVCNATNSLGICKSADPGTNPRNDCTASAQSSCGTDGFCDGSGACRLWGTSTACSAGSCASGSATAPGMCSGTGTCNAGTTASCGAYQCSGTACGTTCTTDAACNGFCAGGACYASSTVNLAGNGNLEYGDATGWTVGGGTGVIQNAGTTPATVHAGTYAFGDTARAALSNGPQYNLPTGAGVYNVTLWAMQNSVDSMPAAVQVNRSCGGSTAMLSDFPTIGSFGFPLARGVWTQVTGTVDLSSSAGGQGTNCQPNDPTTPGTVRAATLYINQTGTDPVVPNVYVDDLVVTVTDNHNLIGNPNFEGGVTNGWQTSGGGTLSISTTAFVSGSKGLAMMGRGQTSAGPKWPMPIGAAKYNFNFNVLHDGNMNHNLILQPTYHCKGETSDHFPFPGIVTVQNVGGNSWTTLSGTYTFPPASAAGCQLTSAAVYVQQEFVNGGSCAGIECPNLYIDDVSITVAP
jgi:hypothetical protein